MIGQPWPTHTQHNNRSWVNSNGPGDGMDQHMCNPPGWLNRISISGKKYIYCRHRNPGVTLMCPGQIHNCDVSTARFEFTTFSHQPKIHYALPITQQLTMWNDMLKWRHWILSGVISESCMDIKRKSLGQKTLNPTSNFHVSHVSWSATHHRRWELSSEYAAKMLFILQRGFTQSDLKSLFSSFYWLTSFLDSER